MNLSHSPNCPAVLRARHLAALVIAGAAAGAIAQSAPADSDAPRPVPGQVVSDVQPMPAEDRDSTGAVVLHDSRVRAQQGNAFTAAGERTGVSSAVSRRVSRLLEQTRSWNDMREAQAQPAVPIDSR
jgi:hypothetical protein